MNAKSVRRSRPIEITTSNRNLLTDAAELRRERATKKVNDGYRMASSFDEYKSEYFSKKLHGAGLIADDGSITDAGIAALSTARAA